MERGTEKRKVMRYQGHLFTYEDDDVAEEFPLTIVVNGEEIATMVCSPIDMRELVVGFLATEGIIFKYEDIHSITMDEECGFAYVELHRNLPDARNTDKRWLGSCCGKSRAFYFQSDAKTARTVTSTHKIAVKECLDLMEEFQSTADMFHQTGGVHQAALATAQGVQLSYADIGRHNALDKIYGKILIDKISLKDKLIIFSGRISSEVLLKVSKMNIGILLSKSAPTNLALDLAEDLNITAIGFIRNGRMNVYTHESRVHSQDLHKRES
ncbi:formate dehydrogenase accessory sulfurtransferase FdhD [Thalassobacillus pellis]|uniref:formate dehydrogenase accessory sulfurtransferase FdhD n=1 Tax=Thalassobacillus pellis TaxID=748008 RepID=UPI0019620B35|nr:formate dehydrogenase accessory sulfurtransferase FdhD [Thalassobacillus pellis]MBM7553020.1 FdhD protein [Thalassobacillus pellis]